MRFLPSHNNNPPPPPTPESIERQRRLMTGRKASPETRAKMAEAHRGPRNHNWKGDSIGYSALHEWLARNFAKTGTCEECRFSDVSRTEWANISGEYRRDRADFRELCPRCHKLADIAAYAAYAA